MSFREGLEKMEREKQRQQEKQNAGSRNTVEDNVSSPTSSRKPPPNLELNQLVCFI